MNHAYLQLGGNIGNRAAYLAKARHLLLERVGDILIASPIYQTSAWGNTHQADFYNQVTLVLTQLSAQDLLKATQRIENDLDRTREEKWGARTMDIDILYFNDEIVSEPTLQIPHPQIPFRRFVLVPLHHIAPELIHPVLLQSQKKLLADCPDTLDVKEVALKK